MRKSKVNSRSPKKNKEILIYKWKDKSNLNIYLRSNFISLRKGCNEKKIVLLLMSCFDTLLSILDMVSKFCIYNCRSNYAGENHGVVFSFSRDGDLKKIWVRLVNRKDWSPSNSSVIYIKHFEKKYLKMGEEKKRCHLDMSMKWVPTIFGLSTHAPSTTSALKTPIRIPQKYPKKCNVFADE